MDDTKPGLLHRWLVEYNPLYLVSAALVLVGVVMLSDGLVGSGGPLAQLGITAIAELYAWALVGSAAVLVRVGLRRPALMLALLAAFYQCDPTLHTETSVHLGAFGIFASAIWLALFVAKLYACAWALRLYLSRSAVIVATLGAAGIAAWPWLFYAFEPRTMTSLLGAWVFATLAAGLWSTRRIHSVATLSEWALVVARRSLCGVWIGWTAMLLVHVCFWSSEHGRALDIGVLLPIAALLVTRWLPKERSVWLAVFATLFAVAAARPELFALTAVMAAATLALHALRRPVVEEQLPEPITALGPYRDAPQDDDVPALHRELVFMPNDRPALMRLLVGAFGCVYLAAWTHAWTGGEWPAHAWLLDALLLLVALGWSHALQQRLVLLVPIASALHWILQARIVPAPATVAQWGGTSVGIGFALLFLSLAISVRLRRP
jgi:hypothetical protein